MPRRVEDMVINDRRTIRDIPIGEELARRETRRRSPDSDKGHPIPVHRLKMPRPNQSLAPQRQTSNRSSNQRVKWLVPVLVVIALVGGSAYIASAYFSRASFEIMPVTVPVSADAAIVATATTTPGYLTYKLARFTAEASATVPATDGQSQSTKASGRLTIYNNYAATSQRLIAGTRFSSDSGMVYRLTESVTIPGYKTSSSGTRTPGAITSTVTADKAGAEYNISKNTYAGDFSIVAYKGTEREGKLYAEAATDIAGGFVGKRKIVDPVILASTTESLRTSLTAKMLADARSAVPEGYIMYDTAYRASFATAEVSEGNGASATVTVEGSLHSILFSKNDLAVKLAGADKVAAFGDFDYSAPGLDDLSFTITNDSDFSPTKANTLIAKLKGSMSLTGVVPVEELRLKLAGLPLSETRSVLELYKTVIDVAGSSGELFPAWVSAVPDDTERISITVLTK